LDDIVLRAMKKWPDVPRVYGWLKLDRRGNWLVKGASGAFERIANSAVIQFIGRNYAQDERGRWFFQNGPQRVFVTLDYLPWVFLLNERGDALVSQAGRAADKLSALYLDEDGSLVVETDAGAGVVSDRDLPALVARLQQENASLADDEALLGLASRAAEVRLFGAALPISGLRSTDAPARFEFVQTPVPDPGEPEC
jgi:hypothetical protein